MTVYADNFNRGSLGPTGPNGQPYVNPDVWTIVANQLVAANTGTYTTLVTDYFVPDVRIYTETGQTTDDAGIAFRWTDNNNYWRWVYQGANYYLVRRSGGSDVIIDTVAGGAPAGPIGIVCNGSVIQGLDDAGDVVAATTDAFNSTASEHGLHAFSAASVFDDFVLDNNPIPPTLAVVELVLGVGELFVPAVPQPPVVIDGPNTDRPPRTQSNPAPLEIAPMTRFGAEPVPTETWQPDTQYRSQ